MNELTREEEKAMPVHKAAPGSVIWLVRGGRTKADGADNLGYLRRVRGRFLARRGHHVTVQLLEDDPASSFPDWSQKGHVGTWSVSSVRKYDGPAKLARKLRGRWRVDGTRIW